MQPMQLQQPEVVIIPNLQLHAAAATATRSVSPAASSVYGGASLPVPITTQYVGTVEQSLKVKSSENLYARGVVSIVSFALIVACIVLLTVGGVYKQWVCLTVGVAVGLAAIFIILHKRLMLGWISLEHGVHSFWKLEMWVKAVALFALQTVIMDIYMHREGVYFWPWIVFDIIVLVAIAAMGHGFHHRPLANAVFSSGQIMCMLSLAAYIALILGKTCLLFSKVQLVDGGFWSYNIFILLLGISIPIYFILRWTQGRAMIPEHERSVLGEPALEWKSYAEYMRLAINIADSIAILSLISPDQRDTHAYSSSVLVVTLVFMCISHVASVLSFFGPAMFYHLVYDQGRITPFGSLIHHEPFVLVDGLLFSLRLISWLQLEYELSAFILKNIFLFLLAAKASKSLHYHLQVFTVHRANRTPHVFPPGSDVELQCDPRLPAHSFTPHGINIV